MRVNLSVMLAVGNPILLEMETEAAEHAMRFFMSPDVDASVIRFAGTNVAVRGSAIVALAFEPVETAPEQHPDQQSPPCPDSAKT